MNTETQDFNTVEYGGHSIQIFAIPPRNLFAMVRATYAHKLGNEVASKVKAWKDSPEGKDATDEAIAGKTNEYRDAMNETILNGTLGLRISKGPTVDPVEAEMERLAAADIRADLKANGYKLETREEDGEKVRFVKFPNGTTRTWDQMLETRLAKRADQYRAAAEKAIKAKARDLEKRKAAGDAVADLVD